MQHYLKEQEICKKEQLRSPCGAFWQFIKGKSFKAMSGDEM